MCKRGSRTIIGFILEVHGGDKTASVHGKHVKDLALKEHHLEGIA